MAPITKIEMLRLQKKYGNDVNIGKKLGVTKSRVWHIRTMHGIPSIRVNNVKRDRKIFLMRQRGATFAALSKKFGLARSNVYRICMIQQNKK
jgi:hypothetical protein